MVITADAIVVGGGVVGSSAAWYLARRGMRVVLLDRFAAEERRGASRGRSHAFDAVHANPNYLVLLREARDLWAELAEVTGTRLLHDADQVVHGHLPHLDEIAANLLPYGFDASVLPAGEAAERWPGIRFDGRVLHTTSAGVVDGDVAVDAFRAAARVSGADVRERTRVVKVRTLGDDRVRIEAAHETPDGEEPIELEARFAVVAAGAWSDRLLGRVVSLPPLAVRLRQPIALAVPPDTAWPLISHVPSATDRRHRGWRGVVNALPVDGRLRLEWASTGRPVDPDSENPRPDPRLRSALRIYAREWLPGADVQDVIEEGVADTATSDGHFIVDRIGPLVVGTGLGDVGFTFTPAVGRMLADLAEGRGRVAQFSLREAVRAS